MDGRKLVVVEANEVPRRIVEDLAPSGRIPFLASLLERGEIVQTEAADELARELYPSQSWASMNTGVPYSEHGIYWYGDPKPAQYPLYWQIAASSDRSVGLVNTLHSSPLAGQCLGSDYRFVIPDCFGADVATIPDRFSTFQRLNTALTKSNSRRAGLSRGVGDLAGLVKALPGLGLAPSTVFELARLVGGVGLGRVPRERIRSAQFMMLRDMFLGLLEDEAPDLAVTFTNHVAAAMHRYWYASYPEDFEGDHYDPAWIERHRHEIPNAMELLDRFLVRLYRWCLLNDRTMVIASSMGQGASPVLDTSVGHEATVGKPQRFLKALGIDDVTVLGSMAPQLSLDCGTKKRAAEVVDVIVAAGIGAEHDNIDRTEATVTITYGIEVVDAETIRLRGVGLPAGSVGVEVHRVEDHSSGRHHPYGLLAVANSPSFKPPVDEYVDYLEFAPAVLQHLGVPPGEHHRMPSFQI